MSSRTDAERLTWLTFFLSDGGTLTERLEPGCRCACCHEYVLLDAFDEPVGRGADLRKAIDEAIEGRTS